MPNPPSPARNATAPGASRRFDTLGANPGRLETSLRRQVSLWSAASRCRLERKRMPQKTAFASHPRKGAVAGAEIHLQDLLAPPFHLVPLPSLMLDSAGNLRISASASPGGISRYKALLMSRWIRFFLAIALGLVAGLYYGWVVNPVQYVDTAPQALHPAYKADYVLMTAEIYGMDGDLDAAVQRLRLLGAETPAETVRAALTFAERAGYGDSDVQSMQRLFTAIQTLPPDLP